jgi:hypothetical protein
VTTNRNFGTGASTARPERREIFMTRRVAHAAQIGALVVALALVPAALAARGGNGGGKPSGGSGNGSSIRLATLVYDANGNGLPNHGDVVTFNVSTTATEPFVNVRCYQSGTLALNSTRGYFDGALDTSRNFALGSGAWPSGAADCTASVKVYTHNKWNVLATTKFHVDA